MFCPSQFPALSLLQDNWRIIADECRILNRDEALDVSKFKTREDVARTLIENGKPQYIQGWDGIDKWLNWGIAINYQYPLGDAGAPKTTALLKRIAGIKFANLSLFKSGTILPWHSHPEMAGERLLTYHLGLEVPDGCWLNVGGEFIQEQNGTSIIFDGSFPHFAVNASSKDRLILYIEFSPNNLGLKQ